MQVIKKSAGVIFGLVRLILLAKMGGGGIWRGARLSAAHIHPLYYAYKVYCCEKAK